MPLYAAHAQGSFAEAGLDVELLPAVAHPARIERLRAGTADLALIDLAGFVDAVAADPDLQARCVYVVTQHLPEAAFYLRRPGAEDAITAPTDLAGASYGGRTGARHTATHQALLRRLGADPEPGLVEMGYRQMFTALPAGDIRVLPDFAALAHRVRDAVGGEQIVDVLRYRDCGVDAYGTGLVASEQALNDRQGELSSFLQVTTAALREMRTDPEASIRAAQKLLDLDVAATLAEWHDEQQPAIFDALAPNQPVGSAEPRRWQATAAWRSEVTGTPRLPGPGRLFAPIR